MVRSQWSSVFLVVTINAVLVEWTEPRSISFTMKDGSVGNLNLPGMEQFAPRRPLNLRIKVPHHVMKDIFPIYSIRVATNGKPHYPQLRIGYGEYTYANQFGALPNSYPRDEPAAMQLETANFVFPNRYRYMMEHYGGAFF